MSEEYNEYEDEDANISEELLQYLNTNEKIDKDLPILYKLVSNIRRSFNPKRHVDGYQGWNDSEDTNTP